MNASSRDLTRSQVSELAHQGKHHSAETRQISRQRDVMPKGRQVKCTSRDTVYTKAWGLEELEETVVLYQRGPGRFGSIETRAL